MLDGEIKVREMTANDLHAVASVHSIAFAGFFLEAMGKPFLRGYYDIVLRYPGAVSLVAEDRSGCLIGFVVGFINPSGFYAFLKSQWLRLLPGALYALLRRPYLLARIFVSNLRVRKKSKPVLHDMEATTELASIAVASREGGVGSLLIRNFLVKCQERQARRVVLTTDMKENSMVQRFYRKHGFKEIGVERNGRREMLVFERKL
ncbi:GNAT family N-acetyltransferase [Azonexus sp.]|uniref:GNAT family N-acetyltransferase n=1 Tax=Azonexus sp. TaxID=1872668 RepID=UPI0035B2D740